MDGALGRHFSVLVFCISAIAAAGCADFGSAPSWLPFADRPSPDPSGIVAPGERMAELRKLAKRASWSSAEKKTEVAAKLARDIRTEEDPLIRAEILRTLGEYPGDAADSVLRAALDDPDAEARIAACEAWGKRGDGEAVKLLSGVLGSDVDVDVRLAAARALGRTKDPAAVAALGEVLTDKNPAMQYRAVVSLRQITGKSFGNDVNRWRQYVQGERPSRTESLSIAERLRRMF